MTAILPTTDEQLARYAEWWQRAARIRESLAVAYEQDRPDSARYVQPDRLVNGA